MVPVVFCSSSYSCARELIHTSSFGISPHYSQLSQGPEQIVGKLTQVGRVSHNRASLDVQPGVDSNSMLIFVTGHVSIDGGNPLHFAQSFILVSTGPGAFYVHNDCHRLIYS